MTTKKYNIKKLEQEFGKLTFGNALESYRKGEQLSLKAMASKLNISSQSLCDIEKGRRIPSVSRAAKIAKNIKEPVAFWIQLALQDELDQEKIKATVSIA